MDIGSIAKDTLSGVLSTLAVMLILRMGKQLITRLRQRRTQPKEVLSDAIRKTEEYQDIARMRQSYRLFGYLLLFALVLYTTTIIFLVAYTGSSAFVWRFDNLGLFLTLLCGTPIELYSGYAPITSEEI